DASGLEWAPESPPAVYNHTHIPIVDDRLPLWTHKDGLPVAYGLRVEEREHLLTSVIDARPDIREPSAEPAILPFLSVIALTCLFIGSIFTPWAVAIGILPLAAALAAWFWPKNNDVSPEPVID